MAWQIPVSMLLAVAIIASAVACPQPLQPTEYQQVPQSTNRHTGSCASIGYNTKCCPPYEDEDDRDRLCKARDGNCYCDMLCHLSVDCCDDSACNGNKII